MNNLIKLFLSTFRKNDLENKLIDKKNSVHYRRDLDSLGQYLKL